MKKKLLYLTSIVLFSVVSVNAQTTWTFSNPATTVGTISTNNSATIVADPANSATAKKYGPTYNTGAAATIVATGFPGLEFGYKNSNAANYNIQFLNGSSATNGYFQANGKDVIVTITGCTTGQNISVQYSAKGATAVTAIGFETPAAAGVSASVITSFPPNCTLNTLTSSAAGSTTTTDIQVANLTVTANGNVNLLAGSPGFRIYKIIQGGDVLGVNDFQQGSTVVVYANDGKINVSNVASATKVSVYSILGSLVKSIETSEDASIEINSGVYVVKAQSAEGTKTAKVIVQ